VCRRHLQTFVLAPFQERKLAKLEFDFNMLDRTHADDFLKIMNVFKGVRNGRAGLSNLAR
jgi:hypothetical protein